MVARIKKILGHNQQKIWNIVENHQNMVKFLRLRAVRQEGHHIGDGAAARNGGQREGVFLLGCPVQTYLSYTYNCELGWKKEPRARKLAIGII